MLRDNPSTTVARMHWNILTIVSFYHFTEPTLYKFKVWVSDRIFELRNGESFDTNPAYRLCKYYEGAAVPGKSMKIDCDEPVTGKFVTIENTDISLYVRPPLEICNWKIFGLACKLYATMYFVNANFLHTKPTIDFIIWLDLPYFHNIIPKWCLLSYAHEQINCLFKRPK